MGTHTKRWALLVGALVMLLPGCQTVAPPNGAHMLPNYPHIGFYDAIYPIRVVPWYDETGVSAWLAAEGSVASDWGYIKQLYNDGAGHKLPFFVYHTSGGTPGCGNEDHGIDVCTDGSLPSSYAYAYTGLSADAHGHMVSDVIRVPPAGRIQGNAAYNKAVICQEVGHVVGLDHNTANPASCMNTTQLNLQDHNTMTGPTGLGNDDMNLLITFYDGHQP